jgi:fructose-1,6-bisphosphatase II
MLDRNYALEAVRVTENAALSAARYMGKGDSVKADMVAVVAMRASLERLNFKSKIVIGEGDEEDAPMLYSGELLGGAETPVLDLVVRPLEGTTIVATGGTNALSVLALGDQGAFFHVPDMYMYKIVVGPRAKGGIDIKKTATENLHSISETIRRRTKDITVVILDRPRHEELIKEVRNTGARIRLISDGDVAAAIATAKEGSGLDVLMGIGGAHEGVLAAAALKCMGGELQGILKPRNRDEVERARQIGVTDIERVYTADDLARGEVMFAATGVTDGELLTGIRFFQGGAKTHSLIVRTATKTVRYMEANHYFEEEFEDE